MRPPPSLAAHCRSCDSIPVDRNIPEELLAVRLRAAGCVFAEEEARLLLAEASNCSAETTGSRKLEQMVQQRCAGLPLEQVLGWAGFCGLRIKVSAGVFIPRRRTELLATHAITLINALTNPVLVELCCGSGAVSLAIASRTSQSLVAYAVDIHPAAIACARINLAGRATVLAGDLFSALPPTLRGRANVVVANAPYVPTAQLDTLPAEARDHEPVVTRDGGTDGLAVLRRIIGSVSDWLAPDGWVLVECSAGQAPVVAHLMAAQGLSPEIITAGDAEATIAVGRQAPGTAAVRK